MELLQLLVCHGTDESGCFGMTPTGMKMQLLDFSLFSERLHRNVVLLR